jgi:hypothetical protein
VEPPADRVGPEALSAGLLPSAATRYSEMVGNASSDGPALRYLESSRLLVPPPAPLDPAEQRKLTADLADLVTHVITAVLDGLGLSDADWERGKKIAMEALMAATREGWSTAVRNRHYGEMVSHPSSTTAPPAVVDNHW